jgi:hypothetical protein
MTGWVGRAAIKAALVVPAVPEDAAVLAAREMVLVALVGLAEALAVPANPVVVLVVRADPAARGVRVTGIHNQVGQEPCTQRRQS